jgi:lipid-A-disaccharide synthase
VQIAIVTGEASGDRVGGQLAAEIKRLHPDAQIWGTGGKYLREAGAELFIDSSRWGVIGIVAAVKLLPRILRAHRRLLHELEARKPDVVVTIDAGALNLGFAGIEGVCPFTRRRLPDTKILYYFPPRSWRRTLKTTVLDKVTDAVATPFPWNEPELRRLGANATFVGHPLLDLVKPAQSVEAFLARYGVDREQPIVGILPGSRAQEIAAILPVQLEAAAIIHRRIPGAQFLLALAPTVDREDIVRQLERMRREHASNHGFAARLRELERGLREGLTTAPIGVPVPAQGGNAAGAAEELARRQKEWLKRSTEQPHTGNDADFNLAIVEDATYDVMAASDVLLSTSGTATLEAAILTKPMVITYRMSKANLVEYQFVKNKLPKFIGMPNLLAERLICPEFIQDAATPEALAGEVIGLLLEPERMLKMREDLRAVRSLLGEPGGAARTARMVVDLAEQKQGTPDGP